MSSSFIPGPCVMCGICYPLRSLGNGMAGDGICELCDEQRFRQLHPGQTWLSWAAQHAAVERRRERAPHRASLTMANLPPVASLIARAASGKRPARRAS